MNCWQFRPVIFAACRAIGPSPRGELELPDAVQHAMDVLGERFRVVPVRAAVLDLSSRQDVAPVAARLAGTEAEL
jgi:glucose-1-phosphate thymidylyltransferase